jgi:hypothetical protein
MTACVKVPDAAECIAVKAAHIHHFDPFNLKLSLFCLGVVWLFFYLRRNPAE